MTAIHAPRLLSPATPFERFLLATAARLDRIVAVRLERRAARTSSVRRDLSSDAALGVRARATLLAPVANQLR
ncbi:hypothetical protein GCM10009775_02030 [Microbacterium aoyamense]|uniref:Uncharacterized protein n=1 Tax=Microbacterium aoyamense TaxID=344166 RepID=A0ABN2P5E6_9MICO|nr:hypothetical protein [Microbacterium aoyamense]